MQANEISKQRRKIAFKASKLTTEVTGWIDKLLYNDFTPEQIADRLFLQGKIKLHHQDIYRNKALGGLLYKKLTKACKKYKALR
ncbi:MAG: hypothetical protein KAH18_00555 [Psychromonas sp.]|nr:hypothetical protein [Psychromonas sp.]